MAARSERFTVSERCAAMQCARFTFCAAKDKARRGAEVGLAVADVYKRLMRDALTVYAACLRERDREFRARARARAMGGA